MSSPAPNDEDDAEEEDEAEHSNSTKKKKIDTMKMLSHRMIRVIYYLLLFFE
jgi:hypothetical protein